MKMSQKEFNEKYKEFLEEGFYGLSFDNVKVTNYLDSAFQREIAINTNFKYSQIKIKFGLCSIYANSPHTYTWETAINEML